MTMNDFEEYIRQGEPDRIEKVNIWQTAIGLQQVDGLKPSAYLIETAKRNIEGEITIDEVEYLIDNYYKTKRVRIDEDDRTKEADKVSTRITKILSNDTFIFSPVEFIAIHKKLFAGIYKFAGKIRDYNISKAEWVLNGRSVIYANAPEIHIALEYDFNQEKQYDYKNADYYQSIHHIVKFISDIWQIHAFGEGNTRTTAVFAIKYLRTFGFEIDNEPFAQHSWYFRNALVRANYNDWTKNIHATSEYLMLFFRNLLIGENNELKNRYLKVDWMSNPDIQSAKIAEKSNSKSNICTLNCTLEEHFVLEFLKDNPKATQKEIALHIRKSERTVKTITSNLQSKNLLERVNGKRDGFWKIIET